MKKFRDIKINHTETTENTEKSMLKGCIHFLCVILFIFTRGMGKFENLEVRL